MSTMTARATAQPPESDLVESTASRDSGTQDSSSSSTAVPWPTFESHTGVYAQAARRAGRLNAASASDEELESLLAERQQLLDKKFDGTISRSEMNRLTYVGWSLDRIEDARSGGALDDLETAVARYEQFSNELSALERQIHDSKLQRSRK